MNLVKQDKEKLPKINLGRHQYRHIKGTVTQKKVVQIFMIKNGVNSVENLKFYMYINAIQEKFSHFPQIMLFVGL